MGFLTSINKISKELKGGWVNGQMSDSKKFTIFNVKSETNNHQENERNHEGENLYFDKHDAFIILERTDGSTIKFKILEKINVEKNGQSEVIFKTLNGSDIYSFATKVNDFNILNFVSVTSSSPLWNAYYGDLKQTENTH